MTAEEIKAANEDLIRAYRQCFGSPAGKAVMVDMMKYCCFRKEAENQIDEGKRRAFLRIINLTNLTDDQLYGLYAGHDIGEEEDA